MTTAYSIIKLIHFLGFGYFFGSTMLHGTQLFSRYSIIIALVVQLVTGFSMLLMNDELNATKVGVKMTVLLAMVVYWLVRNRKEVKTVDRNVYIVGLLAEVGLAVLWT